MGRQRIVLRVDMSESEKSRKKAMKIASGSAGVTSVSIGGQNDQLVVLGVDIDTAELTREIRKKIGHTSIMAVQAAPPPPQQQQQQQQGQYNEMPQVRRCMCEIPYSGFCGFCRSMNQNYYQVVAQPYPPPVNYGGYNGEDPNACRIM